MRAVVFVVSVVSAMSACSVGEEPSLPAALEGEVQPAAPRLEPLGQLAPPLVFARGAGRPGERRATVCPSGSLPDGALLIATATGAMGDGLFVAARGSGWTPHLHRTAGQGCAQTPVLEDVYGVIEAGDQALSSSRENAFVAHFTSVEEVNHRRCNESTVTQLRNADRLSVSPDGLTMLVTSCQGWHARVRAQDSLDWVDAPALTAAVESLSGSTAYVVLDGRRMVGVDAQGAAHVLNRADDVVGTSTFVSTFDAIVEGHVPDLTTLVRCGADDFCVAYPDVSSVARWNDRGVLVDLIRVDLLTNERVTSIAADASSGGLFVLTGAFGSARLHVVAPPTP